MDLVDHDKPHSPVADFRFPQTGLVHKLNGFKEWQLLSESLDEPGHLTVLMC